MGTALLVEVAGGALHWELSFCHCTGQKFALHIAPRHDPEMLQRPEVGQIPVCVSWHAMRGPLSDG